jgi:protein kinase-like protein
MLGEAFPAPLASLRAGSLIAGYRLEAQVGAGGMAVVFRARDERLGRLVALKILAPVLAADPAFRRRFIAESRAAAVVDDPHIIPIYEAGDADGALFIAMRFVRGGDLRQVLGYEGVLSPGRAAGFISPVASALDAAHRAGLVHRDVKPANILVDARADRPDHVYLSDFGVSKGAISSVSLTGAGNFVGTPDYSAPEQIRGGDVDGRTDQYALACVAFQLLTGALPFGRDQGMAVLFAHLSEPPPSLRSWRPGLPAAADAVLARGMAKQPEQRFGSCADFADALRDALGVAPYHSTAAPDRAAPAFYRPAPPADRMTPAPESPLFHGFSQTGYSGSAAASTVDQVPADLGAVRPAAAPMAPPVTSGRGHARRRPRSSRLRLLAPAGAAAAVAAVIAAVLLVVPHHPSRATTGTDHAAGPGYALGGRVPPYFVALTWSNGAKPADAAVRLTATGATIATVKRAVGYNIVGVIGAADDRTFILDEQSLKQTRNQVVNAEAHAFYRLRIDSSGRPVSVTPLPVTEPNNYYVTGYALSPDGTKLAVARYPGNGQPVVSELIIYSVATGTVLRTWSATGAIGYTPDDAEQLSWFSAQTIGFTWLGTTNGPDQGEWLLDLGLAGRNLLADSRQAMSLGYGSNQQSPSGPVCQELIVTPDGSAVVCAAYSIPNAGRPVDAYAFLVYPTAAGMPIRTLAHATIKNSDRFFVDLLWSNPSGSVLIGVIPTLTGPTKSDVVMVTAGKITPLPGEAVGEGNYASIAW